MKRSCLNTDAFVNYWRPKPKLVPIYVPKTVFKLPSGTHFLIPWIPYKTQPNEKGKIPVQHAYCSNKKQSPAMSTSSFHFR